VVDKVSPQRALSGPSASPTIPLWFMVIVSTQSPRRDGPDGTEHYVTPSNLADSRSSVTGHFSHPHNRPWKHVDAPLTPSLAKLVGAKEEEVAHSSTLTSNLHNLFTSFYRPTKNRWKIVIEKGSFPSDWVGLGLGLPSRRIYRLPGSSTTNMTRSLPIRLLSSIEWGGRV
jgi:hypothetical protein